MQRLMKVLPICAAALLFSAAAPGIAAADHGRHGGHGKGRHHVVERQKAHKHFAHHGYRGHHRGYRHGYRYGRPRHYHGHGRRHHGYRRPHYVYVPYFAYRGHGH